MEEDKDAVLEVIESISEPMLTGLMRILDAVLEHVPAQGVVVYSAESLPPLTVKGSRTIH